MNNELCIELIKGAFTLVGAILTAWLAILFYFRQKEYELVKQRYLEDSVDVVASEMEKAFGIHSHNWARCLNIVKAYRDQEDNFDPEELEKGFIEYESANFQTIAHHRLQVLTKSQTYWEVCQLALAFVTNNDSVMRREIPDTIKTKLTTNIIASPHSEVVEKCFTHLKEINENSHKYAILGAQLQVVSRVLEREKMSFKELEQFHEKKQITNGIATLEATYADKLSEYRE